MELTQLSPHVYLIKWAGEGRFNKTFITEFNDVLDKILQDKDAQLLITTGTGKIYSNGLDLAAITADPSLPPHHFLTFHYFPLLSRLLTLPLITVALVQGHAFAGGMVLALSHDHVFMRQDRGYLCMNEVLLPSTVPPGMAEVVMGRVKGFEEQRDCLLYAKRFTAEEAKAKGIIDDAVPENELLSKALECQKEVKNGQVLSSIKSKIHSRALEALLIPEPEDTFKPFLQSKL